MIASVPRWMAEPALVFPQIFPESSSKGGTHLVSGLLTGGPVSANAGPLKPSSGEYLVDPRKQVLKHYRNDSSGSSSDTSATSWEESVALNTEPAAVVGTPKDSVVAERPTLVAGEMRISSPGQVGNGEINGGPERPARNTDNTRAQRPESISIKLEKTDEKGRYLLTGDDPELREILQRGMDRQPDEPNARKRSRFSDLIFTRQLTAFDRQNPISAGSPFHGFFTLFWLGTALLLLRVGANNWRTYGSVFGRNEIMTMMFHRDVAVLGLTDGAMCASTIFCLLLQKGINQGYLSWNKQGWIIQNVSMILLTSLGAGMGGRGSFHSSCSDRCVFC